MQDDIADFLTKCRIERVTIMEDDRGRWQLLADLHHCCRHHYDHHHHQWTTLTTTTTLTTITTLS